MLRAATFTYVVCAALIIWRGIVGMEAAPEATKQGGTRITTTLADFLLVAGTRLMERRTLAVFPYGGGKFYIDVISGPSIREFHDSVDYAAKPAAIVVDNIRGKPHQVGSFFVPKSVLGTGSVNVLTNEGLSQVPVWCVPVMDQQSPQLGSFFLDWLFAGPTYSSATPYCVAYWHPDDDVLMVAFVDRKGFEKFWSVFKDLPPKPSKHFLVATTSIVGIILDLLILAALICGATWLVVARRAAGRSTPATAVA